MVWKAAIFELYEIVKGEVKVLATSGVDDKVLGRHRAYLTQFKHASP